MSTRIAPYSFSCVLLSLSVVACAPPQFGCPEGFSITAEGRCVPVDAGATMIGDGGPTPDSGNDAAVVQTDAGVLGVDAAIELPDAYTMADAYVELPDAYVAPDAYACTPTSWYADADGDGYGNPSATTMACAQPAGTVSNASDCDDTSASRHPGATEVCNGVDDDCDGTTDVGTFPTFYLDGDGDNHGDPARSTAMYCAAPPGYVATGDDCNDLSTTIHPGASEVCDTVDQDCDMRVDEGVQTSYFRDCDGDGYGYVGVLYSVVTACSAPTEPACRTITGAAIGQWITSPSAYETPDCDDSQAAVHPGATYYADCDGDGYAPTGAATTTSCATPTTPLSSCAGASSARWILRGPGSGSTDCFDLDAAVHPRSTSSSTTGYRVPGSGAAHFDYDCDGLETSIYPATSTITCTSTPTCGPATPTWTGRAPACGVAGPSYTCAVHGGSCSNTNASSINPCR